MHDASTLSISLSSITEQSENHCYCIRLHVSPVFTCLLLLIVWAHVVAFSANTALKCQSDMNWNMLGCGRWEGRRMTVDSLKRADKREKEWKRCKKNKKTPTENVSRQARTTTRRELVLYSLSAGVLCARLPRYFWQHLTMPACYHNEAINVRLPHKASDSTHPGDTLTKNSVNSALSR